MNDAVLNAFRDIAASMQPAATDWEWIGPHMSQRMFGITRERAEAYAKAHGGTARQMTPPARLCPSCRTPLEITDGVIGTPMIPARYAQDLYIAEREARFWACATCEHCEA